MQPFVAAPRSSSFFVSQPGPARPGTFSTVKGQERKVSSSTTGRLQSQVLPAGGKTTPVVARVARGPLGQILPPARAVDRRSYPPVSPAYSQDLSSFEQGYETAMGQLFQGYPPGLGGYGGNPFNDALNPDGKTDKGDGNGDGNGNGDSGNGNDSGGGDTTPPPPPPPPNDGNGPATKHYTFLLVGQFEGVQAEGRVFRGYRDEDGGFLIEGKGRVNPFPNIIGGGAVPFRFPENQQVVSDDVNGDGRLDLVVTKLESQGSRIELYLRESSGLYRLEASGFFLWKAVASIDLLDFNSDGQLDVAVLFRNSANLFIYAREGKEFKYLKEIVLPFEPSVVVDSVFEGFPRERRLHVFDLSFQRVASLTARSPGVFLLGLPGVKNFTSFKLDGEEGGPAETELQVFEDSGGIALAEKRGEAWVVLGRFSTSVRYPVVVFGDYLNTGSRQLICLP